jgi:Predicted membrane protein
LQIAKYFNFCKTSLIWLWDYARANRLFKFGVVGGAATVSYFLLGLLFVNVLCFPPLLGNSLAYALSFVVSYLGQCLWTFEAKSGSHLKMLPRFAIAQGIGLLINSCIIVACMRFGLGYEPSMIVAIFLVPVFVYLVCKFWVFTPRAS